MSNMILVIVAAYLLICILIGVYGNKRTKNSDDFLVAGRKLPVWVAALTMAGTLIGSGVTIGVGELAYKHGISATLYPVLLGASLLLSMLIASAKFRKEGYYTIPEALEKHYGYKARIWVALAGFALLPAISAQFIAAGSILSALTNISFDIGIFVGGIIIIAYVVLGGIWAISGTDAFQFIVIYIGLTLLTIFSIFQFGPPGSILAQLPSHYSNLTSVGITQLSAWIAMLLMLFYISQPWMQRSASVADPKSARKAGVIAGLLIFPIGFLAIYGGLVARITLPNIKPVLAIPEVLLSSFNPIVGGLFCSAIIAACMSCADSWIHSGATMFTKDIYNQIINPEASEKRTFLVSRLFCLITGLVSLAIALLFKGNIIFLVVLGSMLSSSIYIGPLLVAWFSPRKLSEKAGFAIIVIVTIVGLVWFISYPWPFGIHPALPATLLCYGLTGIFLLIPRCLRKQKE